jgi:prevent-host-death family protein
MAIEEMETGLPVVEEASEAVWEAVSGGQPICLTREGQPAVVVIDLDTYEAWEETTGIAP